MPPTDRPQQVPGAARIPVAAAALAAWTLVLIRWFDDPAVASAGGFRVSPVWPFVVVAALLTGVTTTLYRAPIERLLRELKGALAVDRREALLLIAVLVISFVFQLPTMVFPAALLHADAAINGLMAIHIAEGRVAPAFYYGQEFMGTLFSHALAALFAVTGPFVAGAAVMTWCFYAGFLLAIFLLVRMASTPTVGLAAALWLAIPPAALVTTLAQSEYAALLLLAGWGCWLVAARLGGSLRGDAWWPIAGAVFGLAFWSHAMASIAVAAAAVAVLATLRARSAVVALGTMAAGFAVGLLPGLVGWGGRIGRFVEWFVDGGGRGGDATLAESAAGLARVSLGNALLGNEYRAELPWSLAVPLALLVVGSAVWSVAAGLRSAIAARPRSFPDDPGADQGAHLAALPLGLFVLFQLAVLATRGYHVPPAHYVAPLYLGVPAIVAIAIHRALRGYSSRAAGLSAAAMVLWAAILLPASLSWLRTLPENQATMNASLAGLRSAGVDTCIGPYWDAYRVSYLTLEEVLCESIDVRRVPGYPERVVERTPGRRPAFVAAPQRRAALEAHREGFDGRGIPWILVQTPRFEALVPGR